MTSEEKVSKFLSEPIRVEDFYTALVNLLDAHAAEQRHMCAKDSRIALFDLSPDAKPITAAYVVEQACLNATGESDDKNT